MNTQKKVGICACYGTKNYGSMLQAFATQEAVRKLGYTAEFIRYKKKKTLPSVLKQLPRLLNSNLMFDKWMAMKKKLLLEMHPSVKVQDRMRNENFARFGQQYYRDFSEEYYGFEDLKKSAAKYETVLVGSDQLWTPGGLPTNFYNLMFVPDEVNKVSYATSFGVSNIPWYQKGRTSQYLKRIHYLSVRELRGAEIVGQLTGRKAQVVADPTLLLTAQEWSEAVPAREVIDQPYIFCYFLGENEAHREIAEKLSRETGLQIVTTPFLDSFVKRDMFFGDEQHFDIGPDDFVNLIRNAKYVLTDSFHGTVFSILHHKQFLTFSRFASGTQSRNSRIDSILYLTGLDKRRYKQNVLLEVQDTIDYTVVDEKLADLRKESYDFLVAALSRKEQKQ